MQTLVNYTNQTPQFSLCQALVFVSALITSVLILLLQYQKNHRPPKNPNKLGTRLEPRPDMSSKLKPLDY